MKNKLIYLSMAIMTTFSLASCNGFERKINAETGKEIVNKTKVASKEYFSNLINKDFFSCVIDANAKGKTNFNLSYKNIEDENNVKNTFDKSLEFKYSLNYKGNHDVKQITSNPTVLENTNSLLAISYYNDEDKIVDKGKTKLHLSGPFLTVDFQHLEDSPIKNRYVLNAEECEEYAYAFTYILKDFSFEKLIQDNLIGIEYEEYQKIKLQYLKFKNGQVDAQEFVDYIDLYVFSNQLFEGSKEGTYETCVKIIENIDELSPLNFFDYTKIENKTSTIVNVSLDYKEWEKSINDTLNKIIKELEEENSSFEMISEIKENLISNLPDDFSLSYSLTFDENDIINNISFNLVASGGFENIFNGLDKVYTEFKDVTLNYDIELSYNMSLSFKDEKIEIETL